MARSKKDRSSDPVVQEFMARFEFAYDKTLEHFGRFERIQKAYGNKINTVNWPTISEIPIPLTFISVEQQLPFVMNYLLPEGRNYVELTPVRGAIPMSRIRLVEADLQHTLVHTMQLRQILHLVLKDCFKYGIGYGLIEAEDITPPSVRRHILIEGGREGESTIQMGAGRKVRVPSFKYIPPSSVVAMPYGSMPDGPNRTDHFVLRIYSEDAFKALYADENSNMLGDADKIIEAARGRKFDYRMPNVELLDVLAGFDMKSKPGDDRIPICVPVLECYSDHHHVWIANGDERIYEVKDKYQTIMSRLVKFSAWPDGTDWFPMGVTEASEGLAFGANVWYNGLVDLAMYHMNPTRVINQSMIDNPNDIPRGPKADIKVRGDVRQAVTYQELPQFPQQLFEMGDSLMRYHGATNAQAPIGNQYMPGFVRGGPNALEELMATSNGRQYLAAIALKSGGFQPIVEKTLILKQLLIPEEGETFMESVFDPKTGDRETVARTVTMEDMRHVYSVNINLPAARMNSASAFQEDVQFLDRAEKHPELYDIRSLHSEVFGHDRVRRTMLPEEVTKDRQEQMADATIQAARANGAQAEAVASPQQQGLEAEIA